MQFSLVCTVFLFQVVVSAKALTPTVFTNSVRKGFLPHPLQAYLDTRRKLQTDVDTYCLSNGTIDFNDHFRDRIFQVDGFETSCECDEDNNVQDIVNQLTALDASNTTAFLIQYNELWARLYLNVDYKCSNACESCWDSGTCGFWVTMQQSVLTYNDPNFTLEEIMLQNFSRSTADLVVDNTNCVTYSQSLNGTLCFGYHQENVLIDYETFSLVPVSLSDCFIGYNGVPCTSCSMYYLNNNKSQDCIQADCTNIHPNATIDSCLDTGFVGRFEFAHVLRNQFLVNNPFEVGICYDPTMSPTRSPVVPTVLPTSAPVVMTNDPVVPTSAPIAPSSAPVSPAPSTVSQIKAESDSDSSTDSTNTTGIVTGSVVAGIVILAAVLLLWRRRSHRPKAAAEKDPLGGNPPEYKDQCRPVVPSNEAVAIAQAPNTPVIGVVHEPHGVLVADASVVATPVEASVIFASVLEDDSQADEKIQNIPIAEITVAANNRNTPNA